MEKKGKTIIKTFKDIGFTIDTQTNLTQVDFLEPTNRHFTNSPCKKLNDNLLYIHSLPKHQPQIIKQLPSSISEILQKNSFNQKILNTAKVEYKDALNKSGYNCNLKYINNISEKSKTRKQNIIWLNPHFSQSVATNVAKIFLQMIRNHFPRSCKLHKVFNSNTVKVSYSSMNDVSKIIKGHNKKVTSKPSDKRSKCNRRKKITMSSGK